ncbi:MAG: FAD-dependent oxidoreductase [Burkholderiaceae bacterium]
MKVAIVGAGVAGLGAAWTLAPDHEVVIYERQPRIGGHALTVAIPGWPSTTGLDGGFLLFDDWQYPAFSALLRELQVPVDPAAVSVAYSGRFGAWSTFEKNTSLWRQVEHEAIRFTRDSPRIAMLPRDTSLQTYLHEHSYSEAFTHACLLPLIGVLLVNRAAQLDVPAWIVGAGFSRFFSFFAPTTSFRVRGGTRRYLTAMQQRLRATIVCGRNVTAVRRDDDGVWLHAEGEEAPQRFDRLIIAANAQAALRLLQDPSELEREVLGACTIETTHIIVHRDATALTATSAAGNALFHYKDLSTAAADTIGKGQCTVAIDTGEASAYITWDAPTGAIAADTVITRFELEHTVYSTRWAAITTNSFPKIQGVRRTYFCGGHSAGYPSHEGALVSGVAAAIAAGGTFPWPQDRRAFAAVQQVRRLYHVSRDDPASA